MQTIEMEKKKVREKRIPFPANRPSTATSKTRKHRRDLSKTFPTAVPLQSPMRDPARRSF
jgi:hypothetical protein